MADLPQSSESLTGLLPEEIARKADMLPMRGRQIFQWLHKKRVFDVQAMTNVPMTERTRLMQVVPATALSPVLWQESANKSAVKVLFKLADEESIESVALFQDSRVTLCLSSQAGCALGCTFCATGQAGFRRNLSPGEISEQALQMVNYCALPEEQTPNIVLMGMGEPFQNYEAVMKAIRLLMHPDGLHIGARKITVSTVGDVEGILRFAEEPWQVRLSVSLHAADDELRSQLVPLNRRYPLKTLRDALSLYQQKRGRQITIEWVLIGGVNDSPAQAAALATYLQGLDAVVNLIPWNRVPDLPYQPSPPNHRVRFVEALAKAGLKATLRRERGEDIEAACGQLRNIRHSQGQK